MVQVRGNFGEGRGSEDVGADLSVGLYIYLFVLPPLYYTLTLNSATGESLGVRKAPGESPDVGRRNRPCVNEYQYSLWVSRPGVSENTNGCPNTNGCRLMEVNTDSSELGILSTKKGERGSFSTPECLPSLNPFRTSIFPKDKCLRLTVTEPKKKN